MAYNRSYGFDDERRRSSFRDRDRDWGRGDLGHDHSSPSRGGPEHRNERGPPQHSRPKIPSLNTDPAVLNSPAGPRGSYDGSRIVPVPSQTASISSATSRPASGESRNKQAGPQSSAGDALKRPTATPGNTSSSAPSLPPKTRDPRLQTIFNTLYHYSEDMCWRSQLAPERNRKKREMDKRAEEAKRSRASEFSSLADLQRREKERDEKDLAHLDTQWYKHKQNWLQHMEDLAAEILKVQHGQPPSSAPAGVYTTPLLKSLEKRFDAFEEEIKQHKTMIEDLKKGKEESGAELEDLKRAREESNTRLKESQAKVKELEAGHKELSSKVQGLQQDLQNSGDRIKSLESAASNPPVQDPGKDLSSLQKRVELLGSAVKNLGAANDDLEKRLTEGLKSLDEVAVAAANVPNLTKQLEEIAQKLQGQEQSGAALTRRVTKAETDVKKNRNALAQLQTSMKESWDLEKLDALFDTWSTLNIKVNFPRQRERLEKLTAEVQSIKEEAASSTVAASMASTTGNAVKDELKEFRRIFNSTRDDLGAVKEAFKSHVGTQELEELKAIVDSILGDVQSIKDSESRVPPADPKEMEELKTLAFSTRDEVQSIKQSMPADPTPKLASLEATVENHKKGFATIVKLQSEGEKRINGTIKKNTEDVFAEAGNQIDGLQKRVEELEKKQSTRAKTAVEIEMDNLGTRVTTLENNQRIQARTPASTPRLESQQSPAASGSTMVTRVKAIEDQNLSQRMDQLSAELTQSIKSGYDHEKQLEEMGASISEIRTSYDDLSQQFRTAAKLVDSRGEDHRQMQGQLEQQQMQMQTLNHELSHINTREMATAIVQQLDAYGPRIHARIDILETRFVNVEGRVGGVQGQVDQLTGSLKQLMEKPTNGTSPFIQRVVQEQRSLSPRVNGDEANKRRRLEVNGLRPPPFP